jgi:tetraacyldisaccharide 4'-kinase
MAAMRSKCIGGIVANADRVAAVLEAKRQGADVVVLDDAFQHRRIRRSLDVVLLSAEQLLRPRRSLPSGPWREPLTAARRADFLVITSKTAGAIDVERALELVRTAAPSVPVAVVQLAPAALRSATGDLTLPLDRLRGVPVRAVAAIGEPELFRRQLESLGARVSLHAFRDHHAFTDAEVSALALGVAADGLAVCTLKDAVKLAARWPGPSRLWYVSQQLVVDQGAEHLDRLVKRALEARATAAITAG